MELQAVRVTSDVRQKFVVARVLHAGENSLILWGNPHVQWHKGIVDEMTDAGYEIVEILGGGWLLPKSEGDAVYVWGKSDRFGLAPITLVREIIKSKVIEKEPA